MLSKIKSFVGNHGKQLVGATTSLSAIGASCVTAFAAEDSSYYTVDASTIAPITSAINSALTNLVPVGIGIMATMIGISLIRRVIYSFI